MIVRATVRNGKFVIDEPAEFPEGTEFDLVLAEQPLDEMPSDERAALLAQIDRGLTAIRQGEPAIPADQVLGAADEAKVWDDCPRWRKAAEDQRLGAMCRNEEPRSVGAERGLWSTWLRG